MIKRVPFIILWCLGIAATFPGLFLVFLMIPASESFIFWAIIGIYAALEILFPILFLVRKKRDFAIVSIILFVLPMIPCVFFGVYFLYLVVTGQFHWC